MIFVLKGTSDPLKRTKGDTMDSGGIKYYYHSRMPSYKSHISKFLKYTNDREHVVCFMYSVTHKATHY